MGKSWKCEAWHVAKVNGQKTYFSGEPCGNGHTSLRRVSNFQCIECCHDWFKNNKEKHLLSIKRWVESNRQKRDENYKKWASNNAPRLALRTAKRRALKREAQHSIVLLADTHLLFKKQRGKCAYCRQKIDIKKAHLDHIQPLSKGGAHAVNNLQWLCAPCNLSKGARHPVDFARQQGLLI